MGNDWATLIQAWFVEHDGDGEFVSDVRAFPYSVIGSAGSVGRIIFTTKPTIVSAAIHECKPAEDFGMVGRYGLPSKTDLRWLCKVIGARELLFLGDMDPVDLMVFAWLRASLHRKHVTHLGVNDALLRVLEISSAKALCIPCAPSEQKSLALLRTVFPDLGETVGHTCAQMLERGHKIELDAILNDREKAAAILSLGSKLH